MKYWLISTKYRSNARLALITFVLAFVVILMGAYTRLTDAGLSCPDWPNCYGFMTAPHTAAQLLDAAKNYPLTPVNVKKAWTEMGHRYFAGIEGILILVLSISILLNRKAKDIKTKIISLALIVLLLTQVLLGMLTVTEKLKPIIVLSHLIVGISLLSFLWWTCLDLHLRSDLIRKSTPAAKLNYGLFLGLIIIVLQIILGGWVSTHYAGLACIDLPYCNGKLLPNLAWQNFDNDLITIHMAHRLGALVTFFYLAILSHLMLKNPILRSIAFVLLVLLALQFTLGILNILWLRPVLIALLHHATAILILLTLITALVKTSFLGHHYAFWIA